MHLQFLLWSELKHVWHCVSFKFYVQNRNMLLQTVHIFLSLSNSATIKCNSNWYYPELAIHTYSKPNFILPMSPMQFKRIHTAEVQTMWTETMCTAIQTTSFLDYHYHHMTIIFYGTHCHFEHEVYFQTFHKLKLNYTLLFIPLAHLLIRMFKFYCFTITTLNLKNKEAKTFQGVFIVLPKLTYMY